MNLVSNNEIAFKNRESAFKVADMLMKEGYVVMLSEEEQLCILNYEWSARDCDRNDMVFIDRYTFEENYVELVKEGEEYDVSSDC